MRSPISYLRCLPFCRVRSRIIITGRRFLRMPWNVRWHRKRRRCRWMVVVILWAWMGTGRGAEGCLRRRSGVVGSSVPIHPFSPYSAVLFLLHWTLHHGRVIQRIHDPQLAPSALKATKIPVLPIHMRLDSAKSLKSVGGRTSMILLVYRQGC